MYINDFDKITEFIRTINIKAHCLDLMLHYDKPTFRECKQHAETIVLRAIRDGTVSFEADSDYQESTIEDLAHEIANYIEDYQSEATMRTMKLKTREFIEQLLELSGDRLRIIRKSDVVSLKFKRNEHCFYITVKLGSYTIDFLLKDVPKKQTTYRINFINQIDYTENDCEYSLDSLNHINNIIKFCARIAILMM